MWQQATGISWNAHSVVCCKQLRHVLQPQEQYVHDWLHCLLSNGLLGIALVKVFESAGLWATFFGYLSCWMLPSQWSGFNLTALFDTRQLKDTKNLAGLCLQLQNFFPCCPSSAISCLKCAKTIAKLKHKHLFVWHTLLSFCNLLRLAWSLGR